MARRGAGASTEDLAAEAFTIAWRKWRSIPADPLPWLLRTALNLLANHQRKHPAARNHQLLAGDEPAVRDAHDILEARQATRGVLAALAQLRECEREAILLTSWDELTPAQAAQVCRCTPGAFRVRLHRARTAMRSALADPTGPPISGVAHA